jgi:hypothetical protein
MSRHYEMIVSDTAIKLEAALRRSISWNSVTVYLVPTNSTRNGYIIVSEGKAGEVIPDFSIVIRPNDNGASAHTSWVTVPYDYIRHVLWYALRCQPILPIRQAA